MIGALFTLDQGEHICGKEAAPIGWQIITLRIIQGGQHRELVGVAGVLQELQALDGRQRSVGLLSHVFLQERPNLIVAQWIDLYPRQT